MSQKPTLSNEEYVGKAGLVCPFCKSTNTHVNDTDYDAGTISQEIGCDDCNATWRDVYNLVGYENAKQGDAL